MAADRPELSAQALSPWGLICDQNADHPWSPRLTRRARSDDLGERRLSSPNAITLRKQIDGTTWPISI